MTGDILRDLAFAKVAFQLRAIEAVIRAGDAALAAAASGGDVKQAPGEAPQSGPAEQGNAQPLPPSKDSDNHG
jgi:hypothetical protein